jgi:hypothetical protein
VDFLGFLLPIVKRSHCRGLARKKKVGGPEEGDWKRRKEELEEELEE